MSATVGPTDPYRARPALVRGRPRRPTDRR